MLEISIFASNISSMTFQEWIDKVISNGKLCEEYTGKVYDAKSKKALMDIVLDANGSKFLCEMDEHGMTLPYDTIKREFGAYINGRYIAEYTTKRGGRYNSSVYCCYNDDECLVETTIVTMLGCKTTIVMNDNDYVRIIADKNCDLIVKCQESTRCSVEYSEGAKVSIVGCEKNVRVRKR